MNTNLLNAVLLAAAGAVLLAPYALRYALWRRANRRVPTYAPGRAALTSGAHQTESLLAICASPTVVLNGPYVAQHPDEWSERDWRAIHTARIEPDYEGIAADDDGADGASWIATIRAQGYLVESVPDDATRAEREAIMATNREFEKFDLMCSRGMAHVDTICRSTMRRWEREYADWCAEHPDEALEDTREWIAREDSKGAVTREFERIMMAEALLVS